jgi:hypothetical protein
VTTTAGSTSTLLTGGALVLGALETQFTFCAWADQIPMLNTQAAASITMQIACGNWEFLPALIGMDLIRQTKNVQAEILPGPPRRCYLRGMYC